ncbi:metal ion binding protein [Trifolium pratense]|uniref:Metal ion binding protein n=1 Tax=Trifolium pratense TaxID=57577 RepID=A0A2K3PCI4_TRIPR|nr:metal ion binding protein [Trifolium pratense]
MVKKTVLKVDIDCLKCKKKLIKTVSSLQGIDKIEADEGKGTLTIIGDADPYDIIVRIRKAGKNAEVVSIGPPPGPPPPKQDAPKKPEEKPKAEEKNKPDPVKNLDQISYVPYMQMPYYYPQYQAQPVTVVHMTRWDEPNAFCTIM